jgi:dihydropteroate synthase
MVKLHLKNRLIELPKPVIMGILNITPDSFSDGNRFLNRDAALKHAGRMIKQGAHIIDVGGESTRPGAKVIGLNEEIDRILPIIQSIRTEFNTLISLDTYKAEVAEIALKDADIDMINDISALQFSPRMAKIIANANIPVILMHIKGTPQNMQKNPSYSNVLQEIKQYFIDRIEFAVNNGIHKSKLILDPGIGFGKRLIDNLQIIANIRSFKSLGLPIMIGLSRKSFLGEITSEKLPKNRDPESMIANTIAFANGAGLLRVHNVKTTLKAIKIYQALAI